MWTIVLTIWSRCASQGKALLSHDLTSLNQWLLMVFSKPHVIYMYVWVAKTVDNPFYSLFTIPLFCVLFCLLGKTVSGFTITDSKQKLCGWLRNTVEPWTIEPCDIQLLLVLYNKNLNVAIISKILQICIF